jgi:glutathione peroxidase
MQHDILNTEVTTIDGQKTTLADYAGRVLLIVNGSKCGLTPQYEQLETLQKILHEGLACLASLATSSWARSRERRGD